ncbi:hypothetical protein OK016_21185 [Vibrio chagasii]|nr:hypothetical protein [Vibrio chagasii]
MPESTTLPTKPLQQESFFDALQQFTQIDYLNNPPKKTLITMKTS